MDDWALVRVKREWVPDWLWRLFCIGNLATFTPWKEILTRRVDSQPFSPATKSEEASDG